MQVIRSKWKLLLYAFGAFGVNLLNLMVGSYLCSALIASGFIDLSKVLSDADLAAAQATLNGHTYAGVIEFVNGEAAITKGILVIAGVWAILGVIAKIVDGIIDIPMAQFTDRLKSRWGRRRPAIVFGLVPMIIAYCCFLIVPHDAESSVINTIYFFIMLVLFYSSYTLTMVTYYATFTEIVDNEKDRRFLTNTKSIADIFYFILGFALVPMMLKGLNIRLVALIVLPLVLLMLIPLFLIKEKSTKEGVDGEVSQTVNLIKSIGYTFKNKDFIIWMVVYSFMTIGLQLFLSGINEYFNIAGMNMIVVMASSFAPVPLTFIIYNKLINKFGFKFAYQYTLLVFALSMASMFGISFVEQGTLKLILCIIGGLFASFSIGAMFAVAYSIPSQLAADDEKKTGISHSAMYFAIQGLFSGVAAGIGGSLILTVLKTTELFGKTSTYYLTLVSAVAMIVAFVLAFFLPKSIRELGKEKKNDIIITDEKEFEELNK